MPRVLTYDPSTGRRRDDSARRTILKTAQELLEEIGFQKLSIEGVASRAGVGKATIYRWWPNKGALAVEAFLGAVAPSIAFPSTTSASADLRVQILRVAKAYRGKTGGIVREMIGLGQFDTETMKLFVDGYLQPRRTAAKEVVARGIASGEFRKSIDPEIVVDSLYALLFHRMLTKHAPIDDESIGTHVETVLRGISR